MTAKSFAGEFESTALNLFNLGPEALTVRVDLAPLAGPDNAKAPAGAVILREAVATRTEKGDLSADALPKLNQGRNVVLPGYDGRQVYFEIDTRGMKPGEWSTTVRLRGLDVGATETTATLKLTVWPAAMPEKKSLGLCHWGYVESSVLKDQPEAAERKRQLTAALNPPPREQRTEAGRGELVQQRGVARLDAASFFRRRRWFHRRSSARRSRRDPKPKRPRSTRKGRPRSAAKSK